MSAVTLTKSAPSVSLSKGGAARGHLRVNLNWTAKAPAKGGFLKRLTSAGSGGIDLDLAALYELADGTKGVVQALGNSFGKLDSPPYVQLDGDDRTGSSEGGETLYVNLDHTAQIRRVLVFAFIYEGSPAWDQANAVVTLFPVAGPELRIELDEHRPSRTCAIALLSNTGGDLTVSREVRYIDGAQDKLDEAYNWGLDWRPGRK